MKKTIFLISAFITTVITDAQVTVTTFAGSTLGFANGTGAAAQFYSPTGVATDGAGNVYVADQNNHKIRKITPAGVVSTFAGSGASGSANGTGVAAQFNFPLGVATDIAGNVYVADTSNNKIRKITPAGVVSTLAGSGNAGFADGTGVAAQFNQPRGVITDAAGNVYVGDRLNYKIRKITPAGVVSTLAGSTSGFADGTGAAAQFNQPYGLAIDAAGNLYVADTVNQKIRKITPAGVVSTLAGSTQGFADGTGASAQFNIPTGLAIDTTGNVYIGDTFNNKIRKITPAGVVSTLAGSTQGFADGAGATAQFFTLYGVATDVAGNVYVADMNNNKIRKITQQLDLVQNDMASKIVVFPNPVTSVLTIKLEIDCVLDKISVTDLSGKIILTQTQNTTTLNVENLAKGIYFLEAFSGADNYISKFVKE